MVETTSTTTTAGLYLFSVIPVVLIVTSSILLDRALRYETLLHRCQIQIWIWLALFLASSVVFHGTYPNDNEFKSVSNNPQMVCFAWAHLAVFFNLATILAEAFQGHAFSRKGQALQRVLRIMPVSCWWSMVVTVCFLIYSKTGGNFLPVDSPWQLSVGTFLATFLVAWFLEILANRRRTLSTNMQGIPTTVASPTPSDPIVGGGIMARLCGMAPIASTNYSYKLSVASNAQQCWLDERQWYTWNKIQSIQWIAQQLTSKEDQEEKGMVVSILASHYITGEVLDGLADVSQLVALKVPFGPACRLSNSIVRLIERYPKPRILNGIRQRTRMTDLSAVRSERQLRASNDNGCLDLHDHEYNSNEKLVRSPPTMDETGFSNEMKQRGGQQEFVSSGIPEEQHVYRDETGIQGGMSEEQNEKLNQVMKDRFGLELPKLKATDFLAVQKGLLSKNNKASNDHGTTPLLPNNDGMAQQSTFSHPLGTGTNNAHPSILRSNNYANGTTPAAPKSLPLDNGNASSSLSSPSIPQHILEGMSPKLQEVVRRRPDLVETLWKQRQQQTPQRMQSKSTGLSQRYNNNGLPTVLQKNVGIKENRVDDFEEEFDSDNEDETTSLIHRQLPGRYKSVDKSMHPSIV